MLSFHKLTLNSKTTYDTCRNMERLHGPSVDRGSFLVHDGRLDAKRDTLHRHERNLLICFPADATGLVVFEVLMQTLCPLIRAAYGQRNGVLSDSKKEFSIKKIHNLNRYWSYGGTWIFRATADGKRVPFEPCNARNVNKDIIAKVEVEIWQMVPCDWSYPQNSQYNKDLLCKQRIEFYLNHSILNRV